MITLLLDSTSRMMVIGIAKDGILITKYSEEAFQTQSELFTLRIAEILQASNLKVKDINEIIVTHGPGSFTGVRIGVTIAKVLAYALKVPLYSVSSLALFADKEEPTVCVLDARNNRSFVGVYEQNTPIMPDTIMTNEEIIELVKDNEYLLNGETKHFGVESGPFDRFQNMLNLRSASTLVEDVKAFKPLYLKG